MVSKCYFCLRVPKILRVSIHSAVHRTGVHKCKMMVMLMLIMMMMVVGLVVMTVMWVVMIKNLHLTKMYTFDALYYLTQHL